MIMQNDREAFGFQLQDPEQQALYRVNGTQSFDEIFAAGLQALGLSTQNPTAGIESDPVVAKSEPY